MHKLILSLLLTGLPLITLAQTDTTTNWLFGGNFGMNITQSAFSNWAAGGENSYATTALFNWDADKTINGFVWENNIELAYGILKQGEKEIRKTDDKINMSSQLSKVIGTGHWSYSTLLSFSTQFDAGYKYETTNGIETATFTSRFMSPGYLSLSAGFNYKPNEEFSALFSPITGKATFVMDEALSDAGAYGVSAGDNSRIEGGSSINSKYKINPWENVVFDSKLGLFASFENFTSIDVNWSNILTMKINDYIQTIITLDLIYDEDVSIQREDGTVGPATQIKEVWSLGFSYKF